MQGFNLWRIIYRVKNRAKNFPLLKDVFVLEIQSTKTAKIGKQFKGHSDKHIKKS